MAGGSSQCFARSSRSLPGEYAIVYRGNKRCLYCRIVLDCRTRNDMLNTTTAVAVAAAVSVLILCGAMQVSMLEDSNVCAIHAGRVTVM